MNTQYYNYFEACLSQMYSVANAPVLCTPMINLVSGTYYHQYLNMTIDHMTTVIWTNVTTL